MNGRNKVFLKGNLGKDPNVRETSGGNHVLDVSIACNKRVKKDDEWIDAVEWVPVQMWGKTAEYIGSNAKKGDTLDVEGEFRTQSWEKDGVKNYKSFVSALSVDLIRRAGSSDKDDDIHF